MQVVPGRFVSRALNVAMYDLSDRAIPELKPGSLEIQQLEVVRKVATGMSRGSITPLKPHPAPSTGNGAWSKPRFR